MKKVLFAILLLFCFCNRVSASVDELYSVNFKNDIVSDTEWKTCNGEVNTACRKSVIDKYWESNNDRIFLSNFIRDGESNNKLRAVYWSNYYSNIGESSPDKRCLADNEYFTIIIDKDKNGNALNIDTSRYQDIRLDFDQFVLSVSTSIARTGDFLVYTIDSNGIEYGPYYIDDSDFLGYYYSTSYTRRYKLISQNLKGNKNIIINKVKIIPYGNQPMKHIFKGDWRQNEGTSFITSNINITGYTDSNYSNSNAELQTINVDETRTLIAKRLFDIATIKWTPEHDIYSILGVGALTLGDKYSAGRTYYGTPYTQYNRVTLEKFNSVLNNKVLPYRTDKDKNGNNVYSALSWGSDCATAVSYSASKYIPTTDSFGTSEAIFSRNVTTLLGNLNAIGQDGRGSSVHSRLYAKYLNQINNGSVNTTKKNNFERAVNQRIKSNDLRTFYGQIIGADGNFYNWLGYTNKETDGTSNAIDDGNPLTIKVDNLNIESGKNVDISFKYIRYDDKVLSESSTYADPLLTQSNVIIKLCSSDGTCINANSINISEPQVIYTNANNNKKINLYKVSTSITTDKKITSLQIMPHGETFTKLVFKLYDVEINVANNKYYSESASTMATYFNISNNQTNSLIDEDLVRKINTSVPTSDFNKLFADFLAKQDIYNGYLELTIGDVVSTYEGYDRIGNEWDVAFDNDSATKTITNGNKYADLLTPKKSGYVFAGWYTANTGGSQLTADTIVNETSDYTIYARWNIAQKHIVTADANGGTMLKIPNWTFSSDNKTATKTVTVGEKYGHLPTPVRDNYIFDGWYTSKTGGKQVLFTTDVNTTVDYTMYARWRSIDTIKITANLDGGVMSSANGYTVAADNSKAEKNINSGEAIGTLPTLTKTCYKFNGWYTSSSGGTKITEGTKFSKDSTIYARWTINCASYKLTADANGGKISYTDGWATQHDKSIVVKTVYKGNKYGTLPLPIRNGYKFNGWYTESNGGTEITSDSIVNTAENHTIYAHWEESTQYKVTADANGGQLERPILNGGSAHIQLITGSTHIECLDGTILNIDISNNIPKVIGNCEHHLGINSARSYFIRSDIAGAPRSTAYGNRNQYGGLINENDYVVDWTPNSEYTDLKFVTKKGFPKPVLNVENNEYNNLNYHINSKTTFNSAIKDIKDGMTPAYYLPARLNQFIT